VQPQEATDIMSKLLPPNIDFYRTPISVDPPKPELLKRVSPSIPTTSAVSAAAAAAQPKQVESKEQRKTSIYGSVSTSDIAANLQAVLAETDNGVPIVLSPESISIIEQTEELNRIKHLGTFEIEIRLSGAVKSIRRTITVSAQE
jgi:ribosomal protein L9